MSLSGPSRAGGTYTSSGRQSLPPLSTLQNIGQFNGNGNGSSSGMNTPRSSGVPTRASLGSAGLPGLKSNAPMPTSKSMGALSSYATNNHNSGNSYSNSNHDHHYSVRGSSESAHGNGAEKAKKKKNKKGMKGWAWVVEDENGNIIDAPEEESDEDAKAKARAKKQADEQAAAAAAAVKSEGDSVDIDTPHGHGHGHVRAQARSERSVGSEKPMSISRVSVSSAPILLGDEYVHDHDEELSSPPPVFSRASSALTDLVPTAAATTVTKRARRTSSPATGTGTATGTNTATGSPSAEINDPLSANLAQPGSDSAAPAQRPATATASASASASVSRASHALKTADDQQPRKRRKTSPPATAPLLQRNNSTSKVTAQKKKTPRLAGPAAPPTRAQQALLTRDVASTSRAGSQHVVADDTPLPPPPPRVGMGEGGYETPKESALRESIAIRNEAEFLREATARKAVEDEKRRQRAEMNGTLLVTGKRPRKSVNYAGMDDDEDGDDYPMTNGLNDNGAGPGPSTSDSRRRQSDIPLTAVDGSPFGPGQSNGNRRQSSSTLDNFPAPVLDSSYDAQYARLRKEHRAHDEAQRAADQDRPPVFHKNSKPAVVLARSGQASYHPRDRTERAYLDGLAGMSHEMEVDAQGFVDNVKDNLRAILKYYFPERSTRRDAFCERIGRGLAQLGWELTDNSDAALLP
ncbi:hypothetical protein IAU59_002701 [Kwoniella sp. CBS 9459]